MESKSFFFEKKESKNFCSIKAWPCDAARAKPQKVFASFFKKKCFLALRRSITKRFAISCRAASRGSKIYETAPAALRDIRRP